MLLVRVVASLIDLRNARRRCGSASSGKVRSSAMTSARSCLSVTSAPTRASSRSLSAPVLAFLPSGLLSLLAPFYAFSDTAAWDFQRGSRPEPVGTSPPHHNQRPDAPLKAGLAIGPAGVNNVLSIHSHVSHGRCLRSISVAATCRPTRTSDGPAQDARCARASHRAACHARAMGPPLRQAATPSHPLSSVLTGFLKS